MEIVFFFFYLINTFLTNEKHIQYTSSVPTCECNIKQKTSRIVSNLNEKYIVEGL